MISRLPVRRFAALLSLPLLAVMATACSDSTSSQVASVSLALTDAPGDVDSVWVDIREIYLQGENGRTPLLSEDAAADLELVELTQLAGSTLDLVSDVEIPAGTYGQMRFVIDGAVLETEGGEVFVYNAIHPHGATATGDLKCPSCSQSGIKVQLPGDVADLEGGAHLIVLDFDVSQSFGHEAGGSGMWVMHPVIRGAEVGFTGTVSGTVDVERDDQDAPLVTIPECPAGTPRDLTAFVPRADAQTLTDDEGEAITATTTVAQDGTFTFPFLSPDEYDFTYESEVAFGDETLTFTATAPGIVEVTLGANLTVEYVVTAATCS